MIRLQFVCGRGIGSRAISWFSSGHLSHVDVLMPDGRLLGARTNGGVLIRPYDYEKVITRIIFEIKTFSLEQEDKFYAFLDAQIGKSYDYLAILAFAVNRNWRDLDAWICSELVAAALEECGVIPKLFLSSNKISPVALALACSVLAPKITVAKTTGYAGAVGAVG
jgi:hypothetical protein